MGVLLLFGTRSSQPGEQHCLQHSHAMEKLILQSVSSLCLPPFQRFFLHLAFLPLIAEAIRAHVENPIQDEVYL